MSGQRIGHISVSAMWWHRAQYDERDMRVARERLNAEAELYGGVIEPGEPTPDRGRDAGGRPIFDTLARPQSFIFWIIRKE